MNKFVKKLLWEEEETARWLFYVVIFFLAAILLLAFTSELGIVEQFLFWSKSMIFGLVMFDVAYLSARTLGMVPL